jgi:hypothetical protein
MFPDCNIYKCTWTFPNGKTNNQIDHILIDGRRHSSILDVQSFRAADCMVAKIRERLSVNKQGSHKFHMERFSLKKLNELEGKKKYHVEDSNRFVALEDLDAEVVISIVWEIIRDNINISGKESLGYYKLKQHKPWFDQGCSKLLDQRNEAKLQWLQDPSEINRDNLNNVRCEASRHFRNKRGNI